MPYQRRNPKADEHLKNYQPEVIDFASEVQRQAFLYGPSPMCCSGWFGAAKTHVCCLKAMYLSFLFPNNRGIIARKIFKELEKTTMQTFYKVCSNPASWSFGGLRSDNRGHLKFNNQSEIDFIHLAQDDIMGILRGLEINWFVIDQAEEIDEEIFTVLMRRLGRWDKVEVPNEVILDNYRNLLNGQLDKAGKADPRFRKKWLDSHLRMEEAMKFWPYRNPQTGKPLAPTFAMITCNPGDESHWIYRRFHPESHDHARQFIPILDFSDGKISPTGKYESYKDQGYKMFIMNSLDNKFLTPQYKRELVSNAESLDQVMGKWGFSEARIHKNISELSEIEGDSIILEYLLRTCNLHMTMDHGDSSPTCALFWAVDKDGNSICLGEYYRPNALISEHRQEIYFLTHEIFKGKYTTCLADPSIFYKTMQKHEKRWSVADEYSDTINLPRHTAIFWRPADNDEMGVRNRINEYLRVDEDRIHPIHKTKGSPKLIFLRRSDDYPYGCNHSLRQLKAQQRVKIGTELGKIQYSDERDSGVIDHAYDPIRYHIASRPGTRRDQRPESRDDTFNAIRDWAIRSKQGPRNWTHMDSSKIARIG